MRKITVLLLLFATAATTNAGLSWNISGSTAENPGDVNKGDELTLSLFTDIPACIIQIGIITDNGADGVFTSWELSSDFQIVHKGMTIADLNIWLENRHKQPVAGPYQNDDIAFMRAFSVTKELTENLLIVNYTVGETPGNVSISALGLYDICVKESYVAGKNDYREVNPSVSFNVIPEPASMLLLGLGAVSLLKSRRK